MLSCHLLFRGGASSRRMNTCWHISKMLGTSKNSVHTAEVYSDQTLMAKSQRCNIHLHQPKLPCSDKDEVCCTTPDLYGNDALCFLHCVRLGVLFVEQYRNLFDIFKIQYPRRISDISGINISTVTVVAQLSKAAHTPTVGSSSKSQSSSDSTNSPVLR